VTGSNVLQEPACHDGVVHDRDAAAPAAAVGAPEDVLRERALEELGPSGAPVGESGVRPLVTWASLPAAHVAALNTEDHPEDGVWSCRCPVVWVGLAMGA